MTSQAVRLLQPDRPPRDGELAPRMVRQLLVAVLLATFVLRLFYGLWYLPDRRYWDEQYSLADAYTFATTGSLRPGSYYQPLAWAPQGVLLALSERLHEATGDPRFAIRPRRFSHAAYGISRVVQAVYGTAVVGILFLLSRHLFGSAIGLAAAFLLGFTPFHLWACAWFKPDALVGLTTLAALWWSIRASERPGRWRFALAGVGWALASSSKLTGAAVVAPLVIATALLARREPRRLRLLAVSAGTAVIGFVALNPHLWATFHSLQVVRRDYATRVAGGADPAVSFVASFLPELYGAPVAILLAVGVVRLLGRTVDRRRAGIERVSNLQPLVFAASLTALYSAATPYFKGNNFTPIVPLVAMLVAWTAVDGLRLVVRLLPRLDRPAVRVAVIVGLAALIAREGVTYAYRSAVPSTESLAWRFLEERLGRGAPRLIFTEEVAAAEPAWQGRTWLGALAALAPIERLGDLAADRLRGVDGLVFATSRLSGSGSGPYRQLVRESRRRAVRRIGPAAFRARGPDVTVIARSWREVEVARPASRPQDDGGPGLVADLPFAPAAGELVSVSILVPPGARGGARIWLDDELLVLHVTRASGDPLLISERAAAPAPGARLWLVPAAGELSRDEVRISVHGWLEDAQPERDRPVPARSSSACVRLPTRSGA